MDNTDDKQKTADELRDSMAEGAQRNVDDIIGEIIGGTGDYSSEYTDMFSKYNAEDAEIDTAGGFPRRDYSAEADAAIAGEKEMERRIARKMAPSVRGTVGEANGVPMDGPEYVRPEFGYDGSVLYPTEGVGESGERVVFDADWENQAKEEAAKRAHYYRNDPHFQPPPYMNEFQFSSANEPREKKTEPKKTRPAPPRVRKPDTDAPQPRTIYQSPIKEPDMEIKGTQQDPRPAMPRKFASDALNKETPAAPKPEEEAETRGLPPERQRSIDNAVLEAFSSDFNSDEAFKERWKETVEKAQRRREQKARESQEAEAKLRSQMLLEERKRRIAQMEQNQSVNPPPPQKGTFTPAAVYRSTPAEGVNRIVEEAPDAERLDDATVRKMRALSSAQEKTITKSRGEKFSFFMKTHFSKEGFRKFARRNLPNKDDSGKEKFRKVIMDISFVALVCGIVYLGIYGYNYFERIREVKDGRDSIEIWDNIPDYELDEAWAKMKAKYPDVEFPEGMSIKFAELYATSSDVVGWLSIPNTKISTVVLQTTNDEYYLYRNIYGKYSRYGNPYAKYDCDMGKTGLSKNTIIYGHNTHDHLIFNRLEAYMTVEGYLNAPIVTLDTLYHGTTKWKIFAVMLTNADPDDDNGYLFDYLYPTFASDDAFLAKMSQIRARSMIHTGVDVQAGDKTLMLYTCYRSIFNSGRLVIVARQLREGESEAIDVTQVYFNSAAIFPAAYYTGSKSITAAAPVATTSFSGPVSSTTSATVTERNTEADTTVYYEPDTTHYSEPDEGGDEPVYTPPDEDEPAGGDEDYGDYNDTVG